MNGSHRSEISLVLLVRTSSSPRRNVPRRRILAWLTQGSSSSRFIRDDYSPWTALDVVRGNTCSYTVPVKGRRGVSGEERKK